MNRRAFLTGLIAAPLVVQSGVLMPLRGLVMPYGRWLAAYSIGTDTILARFDATMRGPLLIPQLGVIDLPVERIRLLAEQYKSAIRQVEQLARDNPLGQYNVTMLIPSVEEFYRAAEPATQET